MYANMYISKYVSKYLSNNVLFMYNKCFIIMYNVLLYVCMYEMHVCMYVMYNVLCIIMYNKY